MDALMLSVQGQEEVFDVHRSRRGCTDTERRHMGLKPLKQKGVSAVSLKMALQLELVS